MQRFALCLRYDGAAYHGWQVQENLRTVQGSIENAISFVANHPITVTCAGRTDAGVHAIYQVLHFDTFSERTDLAWVFGVNSNLPADISVCWTKRVPPEFHARYSALSRRYRYIIYNCSIRPAIFRQAVGWYYRPLDEHLMKKGAQYLLGEHDFSSFRGSGCQAKTPLRTIQEILVTRQDKMIIIDIQANAFLLHMVRNIVGVLIAVGCRDRSPQWVEQVLAARDRREAGVTVAPGGLYLTEVTYPEQFELPKTPASPFFLSSIF